MFATTLATIASAATILSGSSSYQTGVPPYISTSSTSFNLALSGGPISSIDVSHFYQQGAKGNSGANFTSTFTFAPIPYYAVGTIGIATDFSTVINGITYSQGVANTSGITPPDGSTFTVTLNLTPVSGTNVIDTTQNSTATGLFSVTGSISAFIENGTYTFPLAGGTGYTESFSGYALFNGSYLTSGPPYNGPPIPELMEAYTYSATAPAPEPAAFFEIMAGLFSLALLTRLPAQQRSVVKHRRFSL